MKTSSLLNTVVTHQSHATLHLDARGMAAAVGTQEHRVQCGRSRILASKPAVARVFSCCEDDKRCIQGASEWKG
jgi:hypothetical protein